MNVECDEAEEMTKMVVKKSKAGKYYSVMILRDVMIDTAIVLNLASGGL